MYGIKLPGGNFITDAALSVINNYAGNRLLFLITTFYMSTMNFVQEKLKEWGFSHMQEIFEGKLKIYLIINLICQRNFVQIEGSRTYAYI